MPSGVKPLVIVGPSGVGKGTLINKLMVRFWESGRGALLPRHHGRGQPA